MVRDTVMLWHQEGQLFHYLLKNKTGEPLTITDPNMTRFLMSLEEAVELVVHAFKYAKTGDIMVQKHQAQQSAT